MTTKINSPNSSQQPLAITQVVNNDSDVTVVERLGVEEHLARVERQQEGTETQQRRRQ